MFAAFFDRVLRRNPSKADKVQKVQYTGGQEVMSVDLEGIRKKLSKQLWDYAYHKKQLTHQDLQSCARFLFGVTDLPSTQWRLRYTQGSMLYFRLESLQPSFDKRTPTHLYLVFVDDSMGSEMQLRIEVRELWEMLEPVPPIDLKAIETGRQSER